MYDAVVSPFLYVAYVKMFSYAPISLFPDILLIFGCQNIAQECRTENKTEQ